MVAKKLGRSFFGIEKKKYILMLQTKELIIQNQLKMIVWMLYKIIDLNLEFLLDH